MQGIYSSRNRTLGIPVHIFFDFLNAFDLFSNLQSCFPRLTSPSLPLSCAIFNCMQVRESLMQLFNPISAFTLDVPPDSGFCLGNLPKLSSRLHVSLVQSVKASKKGPHKQVSSVLGSHPASTAASFQQSVCGSLQPSSVKRVE